MWTYILKMIKVPIPHLNPKLLSLVPYLDVLSTNLTRLEAFSSFEHDDDDDYDDVGWSVVYFTSLFQ
jgi:hypothetical protein